MMCCGGVGEGMRGDEGDKGDERALGYGGAASLFLDEGRVSAQFCSVRRACRL